MRSYISIAFLLLASFVSAQKVCGWYGTLPAEKRRVMPPFGSAQKVVLISFFSSVYNEKITDDKGDLVIAEDSAAIEQKLQIKVLREFDVTKAANSAKPKKFAAIEMAELDNAEKDTLSRWFFNYRYREGAPKAFQSTGQYTPRNAVLFLDDAGKVFAYIEICFECPRSVLMPNVPWFNEMSQLMGCEERYEFLRKLFDKKHIGYGIRKV